MAQQQKAKAKGRKIGRNKKHQATLYVSGDRWEKNRKRAMRRHLRNNPLDQRARSLYKGRYGDPRVALTARGQRLLERSYGR